MTNLRKSRETYARRGSSTKRQNNEKTIHVFLTLIAIVLILMGTTGCTPYPPGEYETVRSSVSPSRSAKKSMPGQTTENTDRMYQYETFDPESWSPEKQARLKRAINGYQGGGSYVR